MPHRYHVQHVNEDADEGSDLMVPTGYGDRWCDNCGQYQEAEGWDRCMFCNTPLMQSGWLCGCGHRNPSSADACESCGRGTGE